jgi:hypothetical protein
MGRAVAQAVNHRPLTVVGQARFRISLFEIYGG